MRADADLRWYWRDRVAVGLSSSLGFQLDHLAASVLATGTVSSGVWMAKPKAQHAVDTSGAEDAVHRGIADVWRAIEVELRLGSLTLVQYRALKLHYDRDERRECLPDDVSPAAALLAASRALCGTTGDPDLSTMRKALKGATKAEREAIADEAGRLLKAAQVAYDCAVVPRVRRVWVR